MCDIKNETMTKEKEQETKKSNAIKTEVAAVSEMLSQGGWPQYVCEFASPHVFAAHQQNLDQPQWLESSDASSHARPPLFATADNDFYDQCGETPLVLTTKVRTKITENFKKGDQEGHGQLITTIMDAAMPLSSDSGRKASDKLLL